MDNETQQIKDELTRLRRELESLKSSFYTNNFATSQDFNKYSRFNTALKVPSYTSAPDSAEVGEIIEVGGKLYICSSTDTFTLVGSQTP